MALIKRKLVAHLINATTANEEEFLLDGFQIEANVVNPGGNEAWGTLSLRIFGLSQDIMNKFTQVHGKPLTVSKNRVVVEAGDAQYGMFKVFEGSMFMCVQNLQGSPDISLDLQAVSGFAYKVMPAAPNSYRGDVDVADAIKSLANQMGMNFRNGGVTTKLRDHYVMGSLVDQIRDLARSAGIMCNIDNGMVSIWPNGGSAFNETIDVDAETGLVGYPSLTSFGVTIRTVFDPRIKLSTKVNLKSAMTLVNGIWHVQSVRHELATMVADGPWYTVTTLTPNSLYDAKN